MPQGSGSTIDEVICIPKFHVSVTGSYIIPCLLVMSGESRKTDYEGSIVKIVNSHSLMIFTV